MDQNLIMTYVMNPEPLSSTLLTVSQGCHCTITIYPIIQAILKDNKLG